MRSIRLFINGQWRAGARGRTLEVINPATEQAVAQLCLADEDDIADAIKAAAAGFETWRGVSAVDRATILKKIADGLRRDVDAIARVLTEEQGKPLEQSRIEIATTAAYFEELGLYATKIVDEEVAEPESGLKRIISYEPVGPTFAVSPWNLPALLPGRKIASALAAGCSVIVKPAKETPETAYLIAKCCQDAGIPNGVVNMISGSSQLISQAMMNSDVIRKVSFTGSTPVGKDLAARAGAAMKKVTMELGGHAPCIVFPDVDQDMVARSLVRSRHANAGQSCITPTRFFVHAKIYDAFASRFSDLSSKLRLGNGLDPATEMGPLASARRIDAMQELVDDATAKGAELCTGGRALAGDGYFYQPTVLKNVSNEAHIMTEEPFGPVTPIVPFESEDEVVRRANETDYALAAFVFSGEETTASQVAQRLEAGLVGINATQVASPKVPFGGMKDSGTGREGGMAGLMESLVTKTTTFVERQP